MKNMRSPTETDTRPRLKSAFDLSEELWKRVRYVAPVAFVLLWGTVWIALNAHQARGFVHPLFQSLALGENVLALFLRRRKPVGALAGILVVYTLVDLDPITLGPVLLALFTVTVVSPRVVTFWAVVATTLLIIAMPLIHGDSANPVPYMLLHLAAIGLVAAAGLYWRSRPEVTLR